MAQWCKRAAGWRASQRPPCYTPARILAESVPNSGTFRVGDRYLKKRDLDEAIGQSFDWANARVRCSGEAAAVRVEYHQWTLHARIQSDDLWESLVPVTFNSASGCRAQLAEPGGTQRPRSRRTTPQHRRK